MLTKDDLKALRQIVREEVESEVQSSKDELNTKIITFKMDMRMGFRDIKDKLKNLDIRTRRLQV